jgi:hypothetical protein
LYGNADDLLAAGEFARAGRRFERENRWEEAINAYAQAVRFDEAARLLETLGRFDDAGWMLLRSLPKEPTRTMELSQRAKRAAVRAAMNFARAGGRDLACGLLINVGEGSRAAGLLRMAGRRADAVRAMQGQTLEHSPWPDGILFALDRATAMSAAAPPPAGPVPKVAPFPPADGAIDSNSFSIEIEEESEFDMPAVTAREAKGMGRQAEGIADRSQHDFGPAAGLANADHTPSAWLENAGDFGGVGTDESFGFHFGEGDLSPDAESGETDLSGGSDAFSSGGPDAFSSDAGAFGDFMSGEREAAETPPPPSGVTPSPSGFEPDREERSLSVSVARAKKADMDPQSVGPGMVLADRYRIERLLGVGSTARVFEAMDLELDETVALKLFVHAVGSDDEAVRRFRREIKLSRDLIHPNVVRIFEFGVRQGLRFITMELLEGEDLKDYVERRGGVLKPPEATRLMLHATAGLKAAHEIGVIHRDIKPSNLFILQDGAHLKVMDFGLAKVSTEQTISNVGSRVGTPRYMSPEQMRGKKVGPPADLYSLGVVFYEILTGKRTVNVEGGLVSVLMSSLGEMPPPPIEHNRKIPRDLNDLVMKLLAKDPAHRYANAEKLRRALMASSALKSRRGKRR